MPTKVAMSTRAVEMKIIMMPRADSCPHRPSSEKRKICTASTSVPGRDSTTERVPSGWLMIGTIITSTDGGDSWTLIDLAAPIFTILAAQFAVAVLVNLFVVFPLMGRNYDAAVVSAGFGGISLGATPTAMANMAAVAQRYGASHTAFIIVPLVAAFFIDLINALLIPFFLTNF